MIRLCMGQDMVVLMFKMEVELGTTVAYGSHRKLRWVLKSFWPPQGSNTSP
ncbi:hypothetical protein HanRHA438_Chr04g0199891 [Helianthus annuus]|nr:hypothetical protein HanHA300_Chr04g0156001 [Helianthus annuus]KAJ0591135.1 hypothetical protein HanIR_Chr04g0205001 [Helianthus annuus]KAJ0598773.1 hypothetical protein HanHA89_Chr04g0169381 [Helianthus annuus]KAJ0928977.1 hypothetical protein HanRHA438_Chr04g0199891 [Helianthus annuus]